MRGFNQVILVGNCGQDPDCKKLQDGTSVAKINLATTNSYKNAAGATEHSTDWHPVILWRGLADLAEKYVKKGSLIMIKGQLKHRKFTAKEGHIIYVTEVVADELIMLDKKETLKDADVGHDYPPF